MSTSNFLLEIQNVIVGVFGFVGVMFAYLTLRRFHDKLFLIGVEPDTDIRHIQFPSKNFGLLKSMHEGLIGPFDEAIAALEQPY